MCYKLYLLLKILFPQAQGWYNSDHVITEIDGKFYDINGETSKSNFELKFLPIEEFGKEFMDKAFANAILDR